MATELEVQRRLLDAAAEVESAAELASDTVSAARLAALKESLVDGKLRIALVGETGNGKSTLANSLIGENLLPVGSVDATRALAEVHSGDSGDCTLYYRDGVVTRAESAGLSALGHDLVDRLDHVVVTAPAPFLENAVLIDVPGLTSPSEAAQTAAEDALSSAHCIVCVLNCDRLLSMTERTYIEQRLLKYGADRVCFVLNRCDGKSPADLESLTDRARHLLAPLVPDAVIYPYSALRATQASAQAAAPAKGQKSKGDTAQNPDPAGLYDLITRAWIEDRQSIVTASSCLKIGAYAAAVDDRLRTLEMSTADNLQSIQAGVQRAERERLALQERSEATSRRAAASVHSLREQFVVGLKDFALKLRESVPLQVMEVAPDDARRFLPFYIQDSLRRAVVENDRPLNAAVSHVLESLGDEIGPGVQALVEQFEMVVEPPVIPLYVARDRAVLSQGASYLLMAGTMVMLSDWLIGGLVLAGGMMTREIGRQLEAADRRAALADAAQRLVHGSISTMEGSVIEQFTELENALAAMVAETYAPQIQSQHSRLLELQSDLAAAMDRKAEAESGAQRGRQHVGAARRLLETTAGGRDEPPPVKRPRRSSRTPHAAAEPTDRAAPGNDREPAPSGGSATGSANSSDPAGQPDA